MKKLKIGDEVVRGPDWHWDNQDGGEGNRGVVDELASGNCWVRVKWSNGHTNAYEYEEGNYQIILVPVIEEKVVKPIVEKKSPPIKRLNESEFKDVLKEL